MVGKQEIEEDQIEEKFTSRFQTTERVDDELLVEFGQVKKSELNKSGVMKQEMNERFQKIEDKMSKMSENIGIMIGKYVKELVESDKLKQRKGKVKKNKKRGSSVKL